MSSEPRQTEQGEWMARHYGRCAELMPRAISATGIVKHRRAFGQTIRPAPGSVVASIEQADYDPYPDYFFHWLRDSALVIDALRELIEDGTLGSDALRRFDEFVAFSLTLNRLDGRNLPPRESFRDRVEPDQFKFLRADEELAEIHGERVLGEARFGADGALDILGWGRPQNDGPALRALTGLRYWRNDRLRAQVDAKLLRELIVTDLDYTARHWREPCVDLWEETLGHNFHTQLVQCAALSDGSAWARKLGDSARGEIFRRAAQQAEAALRAYDDVDSGALFTPLPDAAVAPSGRMRLDIAVILGVVQADRESGAFGAADPRIMATCDKLEKAFDADYPINHGRPSHRAPALGRYRQDQYYTGGAYFFSTLGAAQFYYLFAASVAAGNPVALAPANRALLAQMLDMAEDELGEAQLAAGFRRPLAHALIAKGDAFMATTRAYTPASGEMAEQFSQLDGSPASARNLAWSYAGFIKAFATRRRALCRLDATT
ncbi:MAG TPA: glycoside hydrolase family 15 protein [Rhodoblastus sp.]|nr:glycoside hydrolase family 15 protein [Rhodoblastus sp.]